MQAREHGDDLESWRKATLLDWMTSAAVWSAEAGFVVLAGTTLMALQTVVEPERLEKVARLAARVILGIPRLRWRAEVHPAVDPATPYIFCQNHVNHFDFCVMYRATPHFKQGLELQDHFRYPVYGWFMRQRGTIPVRSGMSGQLAEIRDSFRRTLDRGHSILAFPEGGRTRDCRVGPFRRGVFVIARDLGVPIVPVAVTGMQDVMRAESLIVRPGREVTVHCDAPVPTDGVPDGGIGDLVDRVRAPIARHVDEYLRSGSSV